MIRKSSNQVSISYRLWYLPGYSNCRFARPVDKKHLHIWSSRVPSVNWGWVCSSVDVAEQGKRPRTFPYSQLRVGNSMKNVKNVISSTFIYFALVFYSYV